MQCSQQLCIPPAAAQAPAKLQLTGLLLGSQEDCASLAVVATELLYGTLSAWDASAALLHPPQPHPPPPPSPPLSPPVMITVTEMDDGRHQGASHVDDHARGSLQAGPGPVQDSVSPDLLNAAEAMLDTFVGPSLLGAAGTEAAPRQGAALQVRPSICS